MNSRALVPVTALTVALLAGCGSSAADKGPAGAGALCQAYTTSLTSKLSACGVTSLPDAVLGTYVSALFDCQGFQAAQDAGRVAFDQAKARACLETVAPMTCTELLESGHLFPTVCADAVAPKVPVGGACYSALGYECVAGSCEISSTACFTGSTCAPFATLGQSCATATCGPGLRCDLASVCEVAPTIAILGAGGDCAPSSTVCNDGLYCATGTNLCMAQKAVGAACAVPEECRHGTYCAAGTAICTAWLKLGDTCVRGEHRCGGNTYCGASNKCLASPVLGGDCTPFSGELIFCQDSWCAAPVPPSTTPVCTASAAPGAACNTANTLQCGIGYVCNAIGTGTAGTCGRSFCGLL
jgi:hypothetical protein